MRAHMKWIKRTEKGCCDKLLYTNSIDLNGFSFFFSIDKNNKQTQQEGEQKNNQDISEIKQNGKDEKTKDTNITFINCVSRKHSEDMEGERSGSIQCRNENVEVGN